MQPFLWNELSLLLSMTEFEHHCWCKNHGIFRASLRPQVANWWPKGRLAPTVFHLSYPVCFSIRC